MINIKLKSPNSLYCSVTSNVITFCTKIQTRFLKRYLLIVLLPSDLINKVQRLVDSLETIVKAYLPNDSYNAGDPAVGYNIAQKGPAPTPERPLEPSMGPLRPFGIPWDPPGATLGHLGPLGAPWVSLPS